MIYLQKYQPVSIHALGPNYQRSVNSIYKINSNDTIVGAIIVMKVICLLSLYLENNKKKITVRK